jgi:hypothetical protein
MEDLAHQAQKFVDDPNSMMHGIGFFFFFFFFLLKLVLGLAFVIQGRVFLSAIECGIMLLCCYVACSYGTLVFFNFSFRFHFFILLTWRDDARRRQDVVDLVNSFDDTLRPFIDSVKTHLQNPKELKSKQVEDGRWSMMMMMMMIFIIIIIIVIISLL